jgi:pSer/pThr/pTyr-binding forkhead associated (FHA) protein
MDDTQAITSSAPIRCPQTLTEGPEKPSTPPVLKLVLLPSGMNLELTNPDILIGRHTTCDLRLPLPDISRRHCRLVFTSGSWHVLDLGSLNGVYVNNRRVQQATLFHRDRVRIGSLVFEVRIRPGGLGLSPGPFSGRKAA